MPTLKNGLVGAVSRNGSIVGVVIKLVHGSRRGVGKGHNTTDSIGRSGSLSIGVTRDRSLTGLSISLR